MTLVDKRIVVDGFNLDLPQGTGIKTYTRTLLSALQALGVQGGVLHGRRGGGDGLMGEVLFNDASEASRRSRLLQAIATVGLASRVVVGRSLRTHRVDMPSRVTVHPGDAVLETPGAPRYTSPDLFPLANRVFRFLGLETKLSLPDPVDIFHCTYPLPLKVAGVRKVTTIHDCIPLTHPWACVEDKYHFYRVCKAAVRNSDLIFTVSEESKAQIVHLLGAAADKVHVTYQPVAMSPLDQGEMNRLDSVLQKRFGLTRDRYALFVGAIEPKKNVGRLIRAYRMVDTDHPLIIVGKDGWLWEEEIRELPPPGGEAPLERKVRRLGHVAEEDLRYLYAGARCFVFPSLTEGFGLPPLEALAFGIPVVTSDTPSLREVCGEAALYVDPLNPGSIRAGVEQALFDEDTRRRLQAHAPGQVRRFSTSRYLERLSEGYETVLSIPRSGSVRRL